MSLYSIVIPVYNSEKTLEKLYKRVVSVFEKMTDTTFEMILVDDSSKDNSYEIMQKLHERDGRVKIVQLASNYGQHCALLCGFSYATGEYVITMDDDLQHPPEEIPKLIAKLNSREDLDVVIGAYAEKKHGVIRNFGTYLVSKITSYVFHQDKNLKLTSFRLMRKFVVKAMCEMHVNLPRVGYLLLHVSNRIENVVVEHDARIYGKSGYTFRRLVKDFINNILTNSSFPLIVVRDIGIISFVLSIIMSIYYLVRYILYGVSVQGWTTLVLLVLLYFGIVLLAIGIIGEYLMRILDESKKVQNYVVRKEEIE